MNHTAIAIVDANFEFVKAVNADTNAAIKEAKKEVFVNLVKKTSTRPCCAHCLSEKHGKPYVTPDGRVTSAFQNKAKASKGYSRGSKKEKRILEFFDDKSFRKAQSEDGPPPRSLAVYEASQNSLFRAALDWITQLAVGVWFFYGCTVCGCYPYESNRWWRIIRPKVGDLKDGLSQATQGCYWACGGCLSPWSWGTGGERRLFCIGALGGSLPPLFGFVGNTQGTEVENTIHFLKGATALKYWGDRDLAKGDLKENLLMLISEINQRVSEKLAKALPKQTRKIVAADPSTKYYGDNGRVYCEDSRLSLELPGTQYNALDINLIDPTPDYFSLEEVQTLLDCCAAFLDIDATPVVTPSDKASKWRIQAKSKDYKDSVAVLTARMSRL